MYNKDEKEWWELHCMMVRDKEIRLEEEERIRLEEEKMETEREATCEAEWEEYIQKIGEMEWDEFTGKITAWKRANKGWDNEADDNYQVDLLYLNYILKKGKKEVGRRARFMTTVYVFFMDVSTNPFIDSRYWLSDGIDGMFARGEE